MYKTVVIHTRSTYWTNTESNDESVVDADDLAQEIAQHSNRLQEEGYKLVQITPVSSGNFENGNGYFHTESVILTAEKID